MASEFVTQKVKAAKAELIRAVEVIRERGMSQIQFWFVALLIGIAAGFAAVLFRAGIEALESFLYATDDVAKIHSSAQGLPWYWVFLIPVLGGAIVGQLMVRMTPDARVHTVADVIEGAAIYDGRVKLKEGVASGFASLITLSTGGSSGREGPVVHIAALISTWVSDKLKADGITGRDLMGCAVAAAVSASFNAPIAGALFALEVVLRHFALHAFAPIVIASVAGTVINRTVFGDVTEFTLPAESSVLAFYVELPAFLILGLVCGCVAAALMRAIFVAEDWGNHLQRKYRMPKSLRPALAGAVLGLMAIVFPHIIGVGYETTSRALTGELLLWEAVVFAVLKVVAVAITMGGRMGGGVFSPSLMVGALTGLAFGIVATSIFPDFSGETVLYALAGTGAVAAAVLGAPISTTLIVFELTGDWQTAIAVMVAVSMSTALGSRLVDRSFFLTQLERRGVHLAAGPQAYLLAMFRVESLMKKRGEEGCPEEEALWDMVQAGTYLDASGTLEGAMPLFERTSARHLPVVRLSDEATPPELLGALMQVDALRAYNRALAATAAEEHS